MIDNIFEDEFNNLENLEVSNAKESDFKSIVLNKNLNIYSFNKFFKDKTFKKISHLKNNKFCSQSTSSESVNKSDIETLNFDTQNLGNFIFL